MTDKTTDSLKLARRLMGDGAAEIEKLTSKQVLDLISGLLEDRAALEKKRQTPTASNKGLSETRRTGPDLYEDYPLGYQSLDDEGKIIEVNQAWLEMLGYSRQEVVGRWLGEYLVPSTRDFFREHFERFQKAGEVHDVELEMVRRDGSHLFASVDGRVSVDNDGDRRHTHCILRDITNQKEAERALRESEQRLALAIEGAGLAWWDQNFKTGEIRRSRLWAEMLGYEACEVEERLEAFKELVHPDDLPAVMEKAAEHEAGRLPEFRAEHRMRTKDGEWKWIFNWGKVIERDAAGGSIRAAGVHFDITDRKKAEQALAESEARYRSLVESSPVPIIVHRHGSLVYVNRAARRFLGVGETSSVVGKPVVELVYREDWDLVKGRLEEGERTTVEDIGEVRKTEMRLLRSTGEIAHAVVTAMPVLFDGELSQLAIAVDISDRIMAEKALARSEERYRTLQANLPVGVFRSTPEGQIVSANDAMVRMYGYDSVEDLMKVKSMDFYCDPRERKELERRLKKETSVVNHECRLKRKDGSVIWVSTSMYAQKDERGKMVHFDGIDRDITARKETEQALHLKNVALREVLGQFESERLDIGRAIKSNLDKTVRPLLASLRSRLDESDNLLLRQVERNLANLVSPFIKDLETQFASLSPRELEVCSMIRNGSSSKDIAAQLRISAETVHKFRHLIRKKLGITNKNINLASFLRACDQKQTSALAPNAFRK